MDTLIWGLIFNKYYNSLSPRCTIWLYLALRDRWLTWGLLLDVMIKEKGHLINCSLAELLLIFDSELCKHASCWYLKGCNQSGCDEIRAESSAELTELILMFSPCPMTHDFPHTSLSPLCLALTGFQVMQLNIATAHLWLAAVMQ